MSDFSFADVSVVAVQAWVGKEFPDTRYNERRIEFIRMGDTVRTVGQLKGEQMLFKASSQFL